MSSDDGSALNRYERAAMAEKEREHQSAEAFLREPLGAFLVKQLAWGAAGFALGIVLGSLTWAIVNFVVFAGAGLVAREFIRRWYRSKDRRSSPPS